MVSAPSSHTDPLDHFALRLQTSSIRTPEKERERTHRRHVWSSTDTDTSFEPLEVIEETREPSDSCQSDSCQSVNKDCNPPAVDASAFQEQVLRATGYRNSHLADDSYIRSAIAKHQAGSFDHILTLPYNHPDSSPRGRNIARYGCNLLIKKRHLGQGVHCEGRFANVYTLLATYLGDGSRAQDLSHILGNDCNMAIAEPIARVRSPPAEKSSDGEAVDVLMPGSASAASLSSSKTWSWWSVVDGSHAGSRSASTNEGSGGCTLSHSSPRSISIGSSQARIEDSVEALDKLEDDLEALDAATRLDEFVSPGKKKNARVRIQSGKTSGTPSSEKALRKSPSVTKAATVRVKSTTTRPSLRKSTSMTLANKDDKDETAAAQSSTGFPVRKPYITRPSSLLAPKAPAKSTKPPTRPSFELPGETVARRLKEQLEARRSLQASSHSDSPAGTVPQRAKSTKAPTRPNFELTGETLSRRKREQREKELKEKEESEKKRREFRAQPTRAGAEPATYPRETATSRARRLMAASDETTSPTMSTSPARVGSKFIAKTGTAHSSKRVSTVVAGSPRPALTKLASASSLSAASLVSRGRATTRTSTEGETQDSRGTSASTGSTSGKRSTVSAEDVQRQRQRGKEIYEQDNSYSEQREKERRRREDAAKKAREEAAERSRQASREWAEKQRRRRQMLAATAASTTPEATM